MQQANHGIMIPWLHGFMVATVISRYHDTMIP